MTENQRNGGLENLDRAIELEKRGALEYFRTDVAELGLRAAIARGTSPRRGHLFWPIPAAASALVALGLILIAVIPSPGDVRLSPARSVLDAKAVEKGLLVFKQHEAQPESPCLVPACRMQSDRVWLIEAAIYRSKRSRIRDEELGKTIERALVRSRTAAVTGS